MSTATAKELLAGSVPFSWEGRYFSYRQVNIWPRPYQQPHPPVWVTTTSTSQVAKVGVPADRGITNFAREVSPRLKELLVTV